MTLHSRLLVLLALGFAPLLSVSEAAVKWRHIPALAGPGHAGMLVGDFDGNGSQELVATAWGREAFGFSADQALVVHQPINGPGSEIRRTHLSLWKEGFLSAITLIPRPGRKDALMTAIEPAGGPATILLLSGIPLQVEREIPVSPGFRPWLLADIDIDGDQEVVGLIQGFGGNGTALVVIDFETGAVLWEKTISARSVATVQLDDDPALELILSGTPGHIVDGATQAIEVTYPAGFGRFLAVGNFDLDPQTQEFIASEGWYNPQIFRGRPFSPIGEVPASQGGAILAHDLNRDGTTDLVVGSNQNGPLRIMDTVTGATLLSTTPELGGGTAGLAIGDVDGLPGEELAFGAGLGTTGPDGVYIYTLPDLVNLHASIDNEAPHSTTLLADVDADGIEEALFVGRTPENLYRGPQVYVLDGETGVLRVTARPFNVFDFPYTAPAGLYASQLDADPQLEIGLGLRNFGFGFAAGLMDGYSLSPEWSTNAARLGSLDTVVADLAGNGTRQIVGATVDARLFALNPATGLSEWTSDPLSPFDATAMAVGNVDTDAAAEMIIALRGETLAFDGITKLQEWSLPTPTPIKGWQIWGAGADCRMAAWVGMAMIVYRCSDRSIVDSISLPATSVSGQIIDIAELLVAVANEGHLQVIKPGIGAIYTSPYFGVGLGTGNRGFIRATGPGRYEALIGSNAQVVRFDIDLDDLYRDGFE